MTCGPARADLVLTRSDFHPARADLHPARAENQPEPTLGAPFHSFFYVLRGVQ